MKSRIMRLISISLISAFILVGCGGSEGGQITSDRIGSPDAPNTLTLQLNASYTHQASNSEWADGFRKAFTTWAKEHPDWKINLKVIPDAQATQAQQRLLEEVRVGRAPDCANVDSFVVPQFIQQGALQPIDKYWTEEQLNNLFPFVKEIVIGNDGKLYAYWWATDLRVLYRNTDLVPEAPRTWDELIQYAQAAKQKNSNVEGYLYNGGRWEGTTFDNLAHYWSQGGKLLDDNGNPVISQNPNRDYMVNVMEFLKRTVDSGASPQRVAQIKDYNAFLAAVQADKVAMFQGGDFQYADLKNQLSQEKFKKWEVSLLPTMKPSDPQATGTGGWTIGALTDEPKKIEACMDFTKEVFVGKANTITGQLPTSKKLFDDLDKFDEPIYDLFREGLKYGHARPGYAIYPKVSNQMQIAVGNVLTGSQTPEQAVDGMTKDIGN